MSEFVIAFAIIFLIDSISPGPAVATVIAKGATLGLQRTLPFIIGLVMGELVLFLGAIGGLIALAAALGPIFVLVKWMGIVYLLWLAWKMWTTPSHENSIIQNKGEGWRLLGTGFLMPFGNPKAIGFYIALLPTVMDVSLITISVAAPFIIIILIVWTSVLAGYALAAQSAGRLLTSDRGRQWLNRCSAGTLVGLAGFAATR